MLLALSVLEVQVGLVSVDGSRHVLLQFEVVLTNWLLVSY